MKTTMKTFLFSTVLLLAASTAHARDYGVSSRSAGRGTVYTDNRGGSAYVGPRGVAAQGADGRDAAFTDRGAAFAGPNGAAVSGRYGTAVTGDNGTAYARGYGTAAYAGGAVVTTAPVVAPLPAGYIMAIPPGAPTFNISGTTCYFINGIYYHAVFYGGSTVYVPMTF